jgi:hypothetical protein
MVMRPDYKDLCVRALGPAPSCTLLPRGAWEELEEFLEIELPGDYKELVASYGPVQINGHLFLNHPSTTRWNLRSWMVETMMSFSVTDLTHAECPGFPDGPRFGGPNGLIPLVDTDRGEYLFGAIDKTSRTWRLLACDGDEQDFTEYLMPFSEWFYNYLNGGDMFGPDTSACNPGAIRFESMPMSASERSITWFGPVRNE